MRPRASVQIMTNGLTLSAKGSVIIIVNHDCSDDEDEYSPPIVLESKGPQACKRCAYYSTMYNAGPILNKHNSDSKTIRGQRAQVRMP